MWHRFCFLYHHVSKHINMQIKLFWGVKMLASRCMRWNWISTLAIIFVQTLLHNYLISPFYLLVTWRKKVTRPCEGGALQRAAWRKPRENMCKIKWSEQNKSTENNEGTQNKRRIANRESTEENKEIWGINNRGRKVWKRCTLSLQTAPRWRSQLQHFPP